jgi:hypothetical protein
VPDCRYRRNADYTFGIRTGFQEQEKAAKLFEAVYARHSDHPGVLHYLIHAYDDPVHAEQGLPAARAYAQAAAAVPHALHMPSHIFTRLGYWDESAATNLKRWEASEADVKRAGESGAYRDFHNLTYLEYAYLQLGRYRDAKHTVDIVASQYQVLPNKQTASDTSELPSMRSRLTILLIAFPLIGAGQETESPCIRQGDVLRVSVRGEPHISRSMACPC